MFTSKLKAWLNRVDPYKRQQVLLGKSIFTATILVYVYWLFRPSNFMVFIAPMLLVSFYELPSVASRRKKERLLLFIFGSFLFGSVTFYLLSPFKLYFFFYAILFLMVIYFMLIHWFGELKNIVMLIVATLTITIGLTPPANLQVALNMISSGLLSMITMFICLRIYPNKHLIIWRQAMQMFIQNIECDIDCLIHGKDRVNLSNEINHLNAARSVRALLLQKDMFHTYRISVYIRNIQFALDSINYEPKNSKFWQMILAQLTELRSNIFDYRACQSMDYKSLAITPIQIYVSKQLDKTIYQWEQLCLKKQN